MRTARDPGTAGGGSIIDLSSAAGRFGFALRSSYAAAKWGVAGFAKSLAIELGPDGIRADALAAVLREAADKGEADDGSHYDDHRLAALERLVTAKGLTEGPALQRRKHAWAEVYRSTPHGQPVELKPPR